MDASFSSAGGAAGGPQPDPRPDFQPQPISGIGAEDEGVTAAAGVQWNPLTAAALVGGAVAAGAGAYLGAKALARRNAGKDGRINSVLCTAITASETSVHGDK